VCVCHVHGASRNIGSSPSGLSAESVHYTTRMGRSIFHGVAAKQGHDDVMVVCKRDHGKNVPFGMAIR
jgi:hypothetical protein